MIYAKLPDGATESAEHTATAPDSFRTEADLLAGGFLPLAQTDPPDEDAGTGYYWNARYKVEEGRVVQFWVREQAAVSPRVFSRLKLKMALARQGLLPQFLAVLEQIELVPGSGYMASEAFGDAVTLSEDYDGFAAAVAAVKTALGVTDDDVERILAASVAE